MLAHGLVSLLDAGMSIAEAFASIASQEEHRETKALYASISESVSKGRLLSMILVERNIRIHDLIRASIEVGEKTGSLGACLGHAAKALKKTHALKRKMVEAMVYPCCILILAGSMVLGIVCYIFPQILPVLTSLQVPLPTLTKILIHLSAAITAYGAYIVSIPALFLILSRVIIKRSSTLRMVLGMSLYKVPFFSGMVVAYRTAQACRVLVLQLANDIPLADAWNTLSTSSPSLAESRAYMEISQRLLNGERLSLVLLSNKIMFPSILFDFVRIGERTGTLEKNLARAADMCETTIENHIKRLTSLLEPALMTGIGLIIGVCALGILMPIYEVTQHIH
jgi:type II secretory pathway component PulF